MSDHPQNDGRHFWDCDECEGEYVTVKIGQLMDRDTYRLLERIRLNRTVNMPAREAQAVRTLADLLR